MINKLNSFLLFLSLFLSTLFFPFLRFFFIFLLFSAHLSFFHSYFPSKSHFLAFYWIFCIVLHFLEFSCILCICLASSIIEIENKLSNTKKIIWNNQQFIGKKNLGHPNLVRWSINIKSFEISQMYVVESKDCSTYFDQFSSEKKKKSEREMNLRFKNVLSL